MKYDYERIALWTIVLALVVMVFFQQRRSGFRIQTGADSNLISMFDLMEYKYIPEAKRVMYKNMITSNAATFTALLPSGADPYRAKIDEITRIVLPMPSTFIPSPAQQCPPNVIVMGGCSGSYSACPPELVTMTGTDGKTHCVCQATTTGQRYTMSPPMTGDAPPVCSTSTANCPQKTLTETATGQRMCVSACPPLGAMPGTTCV